MTIDDLQALARDWFVGNERLGERFGVVGITVSGSTVIDTGDGRTWVTLDDGTAVKAVNKRVARKGGLRVIVKPNRDGEMEIMGIASAEMIASANNNGYGASNLETPPHQHFIGSGLEDPVEARRLLTGLVHAYSGTTVKIRAFDYRYNGTDKAWLEDTYDLSSFRPSTSTYWAWVKVGINPATNTKIAIKGTEYASKALLTKTALDAVDFATQGYIPLAGVKLQQGQTASPLEVDFFDARHIVADEFDPRRLPPSVISQIIQTAQSTISALQLQISQLQVQLLALANPLDILREQVLDIPAFFSADPLAAQVFG